MGCPIYNNSCTFAGIRPFMDFGTGMVGMQRGISYQSLCEELYVEIHPGYQSGPPSKAQIRRALKGLFRAGVIRLQSKGKKLLILCLLAERDYCVQNKGVTKPSHQAVSSRAEKNKERSDDYVFFSAKADRGQTAKGVTPPEDNNYFYFLWENFEKFWHLYPIKKSKQKAWEVFQTLNPSAEEFQIMLSGLEKQCAFYHAQRAKGHWVAHWKYPANWLAQGCWDDDVSVAAMGADARHHPQQPDVFWEACKGGDYDDDSQTTNIIQWSDYQEETPSD